MTEAPQDSMMDGRMSGLQKRAVALCIGINMLDGFDVLAAAFAAPSLSAAWKMSPSTLGLVLGAGPIGMALGSLLLSPLADRIGRRAILIICMAVMGAGMFASAAAPDPQTLMVLRVLTGLGIGGALASASTMTAEFSNRRSQALNLSMYAGGYPIGATLGGLAALPLLEHFGWPAIFILGGVLSAVMIPLLIFALPESVAYLEARGTPRAQARADAIRRRMGKGAAPARPRTTAGPAASRWTPEVIRNTLLLCVAYFFVMQALYFVLQWTPKVLVDSGLSVKGGVSGGALMNFGGIFGSFLFGLAALRIAAKRLTSVVCALAFAMMVVFTFAPLVLSVTYTLAFCVGVLVFAAMTGLYAVAPLVFPAPIRATGTGLALSVGRLGAIVGPVLTGILIQQGWPRWGYSIAMTTPLLISALVVLRVRTAGTPLAVPDPDRPVGDHR